MTIHVVQPGETLISIANQYNVLPERIELWNELPNPDNLVVGQSIIIMTPDVIHTVAEGDTLFEIAQTYEVTPTQILQNNPWIAETEGLIPGQTLFISYAGEENLRRILINGYAYPFIDRTVLRKTLPYLTYLSIFTYGFTPEGELVPPDDEELIALALDYNVAPIMMLAPMTPEGEFSNAIANAMFTNPEAQNRLINNILATLEAKNYYGLDIDFEFVLPTDRQNFINFIANVQSRLEPEGYITMVALAPKTSGEMTGLLYEAHDYPAIGAIADDVLLMTYEWGYTYGPPMATAPVNSVRRVLDYGVSVIPRDKILMGIPNYSYDWPLPFVKGQTVAEALGNQESVARAAEYGVTIQFDELAQAPYYFYTDAQGIAHVVWFDDARSMEAKYRLINEYNIEGAGVWQIMKFFPQSWFVVTSLYDVTKVI
jgi:spore germination protein